jgi:hypothetical protein
MPRGAWVVLLGVLLHGPALAQDEFYGPASVGSNEPLFPYDDQQPWKHGYLHIMPFYGGHFFFRPYNYKQVIAQSQTAAGWGMPGTMPYSQQFWHRYAYQADLSNPRLSNVERQQYEYELARLRAQLLVQPTSFPATGLPQQASGTYLIPGLPAGAAPESLAPPDALRQYLQQGPALP